MAYLGKFPTGEHAGEAHNLLNKAQRSSEGCLLRLPISRTFSWSGKCSEGMAVGAGVLKWTTAMGLEGTVEGRGAFNSGIMVGRWTFDYAFTAPTRNPIVHRVVDFDSAGNLSKQQSYTRRDGARYQGETNASMDNYFGNSNGEGSYVYANGDEYRGTFLNGNGNGSGVKTYKSNLRYKRYIGSHANGQFEGLGTLEFTDGSALRGNYKRGTDGFDGTVDKLRADGSVSEIQTWRDGKPEGAKESPIKGL